MTIFIQSDGNYSIVAPNYVLPNTDYNIVVSLKKTSQSTKVKCTIDVKYDGNKGEYSGNEKLFENGNFFGIITIGIDSKFKKGLYTLTCEGMGDINFKHTKSVIYEELNYLIMTQTDKGMYRPGETVLFRTIVLNSELKPVSSFDIKNSKIFIKDPSGSRIMSFAKVRSKNFNFSFEFDFI